MWSGSVYWRVMQFHYIMLPAMISALVSLFVAYYAFRRRHSPGAGLFTVVMIAISIWSIGNVIEASLSTFPSMFFWARFQYLGILTVPGACLSFALRYTGKIRWLTPVTRSILITIPVITLILVWTNGYHHLIWEDIWVVEDGPLPLLDSRHGFGFWIHTAYSYLLLAGAAALLFVRIFSSLKLYRKQAIAMIIAVVLSVSGNAIYIAGFLPIPKIDLTPFTFMLVGLILAFGLFKFRLLDIVPIARNVVIEKMNDMVIILDGQNRIVDLNPAAVRLVCPNTSDVVGMHIGDVLPALISTVDDLSKSDSEALSDGEITIGEGESKKHFNVHISHIHGRDSELMGKVINLFDITETRKTEEALQRTESANRALIEAIPDLIIRLRSDGSLLDLILPSSLESELRQAQIQGMSVYDIPALIENHLPTAVIDDGMEKLGQAISKKVPQSFEFEISMDQHLRYFEARIVLSGNDEAIVIVRDTTDRKHAEAAREKEMMLMETHHRVKNNLQVVSSLLYLQSKDIQDEKIRQMFKDSQDRVRSMALIHEKLYQSDELKGVDLGDYIKSLAKDLIGSYNHLGYVSFKADTEPVIVGIEKATPCGLIVNEIISNSLKHAFPSGRDGEISVSLAATGPETHKTELTIGDNGVGLPDTIEVGKTGTLGLTVIETLVRQIGGSIEIDRTDGTLYRIIFPSN